MLSVFPFCPRRLSLSPSRVLLPSSCLFFWVFFFPLSLFRSTGTCFISASCAQDDAVDRPAATFCFVSNDRSLDAPSSADRLKTAPAGCKWWRDPVRVSRPGIYRSLAAWTARQKTKQKDPLVVAEKKIAVQGAVKRDVSGHAPTWP